MSCVIIFGFNKDGESFEIAEVSNAWLGAFSIWDRLSLKYLGRKMDLYNYKKTKETWKLADDDRLNSDEKITLLSTFDNYILKKSEIPRLVKAYENFGFEGTNLEEQCTVLQDVFENWKDVEYIGFHQNSISCDMWTACNLFEVRSYMIFEDRSLLN